MRLAAYPTVAILLATPAVAQDRPLTVEVTEVYRVGGVNAREGAFFGPSLQVSFDGAGNLLVLDAFNERVVVIGPDGELVRVVGRAGEGPGEFRRVKALAVWRDGRFAVPDGGHSAIQVFSPDGELERFVRVTGEDNPLSSALGHEEIRGDPLGDGLIAQGVAGVLVEMMHHMNRRMGFPEDETPPGVDDRVLETLDVSGDVVVQEPILQAYAIKLARPDGSVTDVLRRPLWPQGASERIRQGMIASRLQRLDEWLKRGSSTGVPFITPDSEERRRKIRSRGFYHEVPVVRGIGATWDGGLWIQRRGEDPWDDEGPIDVFNADREYLGTLPAGDPGMPEAFGPDGLVVHLERDEFDVPTLVVSRLQGLPWPPVPPLPRRGR